MRHLHFFYFEAGKKLSNFFSGCSCIGCDGLCTTLFTYFLWATAIPGNMLGVNPPGKTLPGKPLPGSTSGKIEIQYLSVQCIFICLVWEDSFIWNARKYSLWSITACELNAFNTNPPSSLQYHPGLAEIPAPVGSQEVVDTPTNAHC